MVNVRVAKANLVITEVPSFESPRVHGVSNLNAYRDGLRVLRTILAERRHSRGLRARWRAEAASGSTIDAAQGTAGSFAQPHLVTDMTTGAVAPGRWAR